MNYQKRLLWALLLLTLQPISIFPQGETAIEKEIPTEEQTNTSWNDNHITGHVIDADTREHLPFINISVKGTLIGTVTDATGHYLLKNLKEGEIILCASCIGYKTEEKKINVEAGKTIEVFFELHEESIAMEEVVVSSNRNETNKKEASTIVNVISPLTIEKTASNTMSDVLNFQSGLRVEQTCANCGVPQVRINGLSGQYSQILLDSRPILSSLASVYGLEQLPTEMVQRVEVIRGGGSALFGSNAIGGVVNIITKEPTRNQVNVGNTTQLMGGNTPDFNTTLNASFVTDDFKSGIYLFGVMRQRNGYDHNGDGFTDIPILKSETMGFRGYHKLSNYSKLTAEYHHTHEFRRGGDSTDLPPHKANLTEQLEHYIDGGALKYDWFSDDYANHLNAYASLQSIRRESFFGSNKNPDAYGKTKDFTWLVGSQFTHSFENFLFMPADLTVGAEYSYNNLNDNMQAYHRTLEQKVHVVGAYLQNEWKNLRWSFLVGVRLDKHSTMSKPVACPRATVRYSPSKWVGLRASYSSGYRAPQAYDEDLHVAAVGGDVALIRLSDGLKPEYSHSFNASIDLYHNFGEWEGNLLIEGFYTTITDVFSLVEKERDAQHNILLERTNASGCYVTGANAEFKLSYHHKWIIQGGYTFQISRYKDPFTWSNNPELKPQKRMFRTPDFYGFITLGYSPIKRLNLNFTGNHTGSMLIQHYAHGEGTKDSETESKGFFDALFRVSYEFPLSKTLGLEVNAGVKNIFNSFQNDLDWGKDKDAKYIYGPSFPRTYFAGVKLKL